MNTTYLLCEDILYGTGFDDYGTLNSPFNYEKYSHFNIIEDLNGIKIKSFSNDYLNVSVVDEEGNIWTCGKFIQKDTYNEDQEDNETFKFKRITCPTYFTQVFCGSSHTIALDIYGDVWAYGTNEYGQLGFGDNINRNKFEIVPKNYNIVSASCGLFFTLLLDNNGICWSCGRNQFGELGLGNNVDTNIFSPIKCLNKITSVSSGCSHSCIIDNKNTIYTFGANICGQLGNRSRKNSNSLIPHIINNNILLIGCGSDYTLAMDSDFNIWCAGSCRFTINNSPINNYTYFEKFCLDKFGITSIKDIYCGSFHILVLDYINNLWGFGKNNNGCLGLGLNYNSFFGEKINFLENYPLKISNNMEKHNSIKSALSLNY